MKHVVRALLAAGLPALGATLPGCGPPAPPAAPQPPEVRVVAVEERDVPLDFELVGQTKGSRNIEIRARVSGYLLSADFAEGEPVALDQQLYVIDRRPFEAALARAEGDVALARADVGRAEQDVARLQPLVAENAVPRQDYETAVSLLRAAEARLVSAQALEQSARIDLGFTVIRSPVAGLVGENKVSAGNLVTAGESLLTTVSVIDPIHARFSLSEQEYLRLMRARLAGELPERDEDARPFEIILADGSLHPERGRVAFLDRSVDARTGTLNVEASFPNPDGLLRPGQFARVRVQLELRAGARLVPQRAVRELQATFQVAVVHADGRVELRTVAPGPRVGTAWIIEEGLQPGERVIVDGLQKVRDGMVVRASPLPPEPAAAPAGG